MYENLLVVVKMLVKAVDNKVEVEAAKKLNLEVAVAVVLVMAVLAVVLVLLDMEKDLLMMEEEKGRSYLQLVRQTPPSILRV